MARAWNPDDVPDQTGRRVLVTGAASGVGRATALDLAARGAELVLADRDLDALAVVARRADAAGPHRPTVVHLDLADLDSARDAAAAAVEATGGRLDLLVVDDGSRERGTTPEGVDRALASRLFGSFALVSRLWETLGNAARGRVVTVVPPSYRLARELSLDEAGGGDGLLRRTALGAPSEAALAGLLLALELAERARGRGFRSLAAVAGLDPTAAVERTERLRRGRGPGILDTAMGALGQRGGVAHHPVLMAATADLPAATLVGFGGALGLGTTARIINPPSAARDRELRQRIWELARSETGEDPA